MRPKNLCLTQVQVDGGVDFAQKFVAFEVTSSNDKTLKAQDESENMHDVTFAKAKHAWFEV